MDARHDEQRLIMRVLAHYRELCRGGALPRRAQIDPAFFGRDWSNCLLIDIDPELERSRFAYVGEKLGDPTWPAFERQTLGECRENSLLHVAAAYIARVMAQALPISRGGIGMHQDIPMVYRSILLPLSENGRAIDGMLGAANFREVPVTEEIHPLRAPSGATMGATAELSVSA